MTQFKEHSAITSSGQPGIGVSVHEQLHVEQLAHFWEVEHQDSLDKHHVRRVDRVGSVLAAQKTIKFRILYYLYRIFIIIAYLCPHCWATSLPYGLHIRRTGHNLPRGPSSGWWVLTTANTAGTNGLTCLPKHGRARDSFCHPSND
jgi:hypothetical protein